MSLFENVDLEKHLLDALTFICKKYINSAEITFHENHKGLTIKVDSTKYIFFGDGKVVISEKSDKGLANTMKEENVI